MPDCIVCGGYTKYKNGRCFSCYKKNKKPSLVSSVISKLLPEEPPKRTSKRRSSGSSYKPKKYGSKSTYRGKKKKPEPTPEARNLYNALKSRGVPAELEKNDGFKHIDIAVVEAKVNIEIDGGHHNFNKNQALRDLKRTFHSFKKGYVTLRIPNALVKHHLEETADYIVDFLNASLDQLEGESLD